MNTLESKAENYNICKYIQVHIHLFESFDKVYLFGSSLYSDKIANDIDILLVYSVSPEKIINEISYINSYIEADLNLPVDITALNTDEINQVEFLKKLNSKYIEIK